MTIEQALGLIGGIALLAFIIFALRQGAKVKPEDRPDHGSVGGGPDS